MAIPEVSALTFDVGGSIFDWQTAVHGEVRRLAEHHGAEVDHAAFAMAWRIRMFQLLAEVRAGRLPWLNADQLHRRALDDLAESFPNLPLTAQERDRLTDVWHHLEVWPDVPEALTALRRRYRVIVLTVLSFAIAVDSSKHAAIEWDGVLSCEFLGHYKPDPQAYLAAARLLRLPPERVMMVAVHPADLTAAAAAGLATAFVAPKLAEPGGAGDTSGFDVRASDYADLLRQLA